MRSLVAFIAFFAIVNSSIATLKTQKLLKNFSQQHLTTQRVYHIALKSNQIGVEYMKNYITNHIANPKSKYYGQFLSQEEINRIVSPSPSNIARVDRWLKSQNVKKYFMNGDIITISATNFNYKIPDYLKDVVEFVSIPHLNHKLLLKKFKNEKRKRFTNNQQTLKSLSKSRKNLSKTPSPTSPSQGIVGREVIMRLYNITNGYVDKNLVSMGAMEYEGNTGFSNNDVQNAQMSNGVPSNPVSNNHILGVNDPAVDIESELDMSVIWWGGANSTLWYESFSGWMFDWAAQFLNRTETPQVVSLSYGWNENAQCGDIIVCPNNESSETYTKRTNQEFMKMVAKGTTILAASGDAGSPGKTDMNCEKNSTFPVFPGSSEWILSVGASYVASTPTVNVTYTTNVCKNWSAGCTKGSVEQMTNIYETSWTSGAGFSKWTSTPSWQAKHVKKYLESGVTLPKSTFFNAYGRGYPDVTTIGHLCSMKDSQYSNAPFAMDGTSCSSPVMAGIITNLNNFQLKRGKPVLGAPHVVLYKMYEDDPTIFHDISVGYSGCTESMCCNQNHGFYPMAGMWDVVSGLGSPNVGKMKEWLSKNT